MNKISFLTYLIAIFSFISCNGKAQNSIEKAIEKTDSCILDAKNKYEVYIPQRNSGEKLPLLVIIDAHGSGKFALNKFKLSVDKFPAVVVASDYVKNGFEGFEDAIRVLIDDVNQKYKTNNTLFLTGFSGGARMALGYALNHPTNGLILCGALADAQQLNSLSCPVFSISGMDDFNFIETAQYLFDESKTPQNLKIELINASHSWPDSLMLTNAFGFLYLSKSDKKSFGKNQLSDYCNEQVARIDSLKRKGDYLKAKLIAQNLATTEPFNKQKDFATIYNNLKSDVSFVSQLNQLGESLNFELQKRQDYLNDFQVKDTSWWATEIKQLDEDIKSEKNELKKDGYQRQRAFLGIVCYSYCKQAVAAKNAEALSKILFIYRTLEPNNSDMYYFSAFPYFWKGDNANTILTLNKAVKAGFTNINQLKNDFQGSISANY